MLEYLVSETKNGRQLSPSPVICLVKRVTSTIDLPKAQTGEDLGFGTISIHVVRGPEP